MLSPNMNLKKTSLSLALAIIIAVITFTACTYFKKNDFDLNVTKITLKNGIRVLLIKRPGAPIFSGFIRIKVGNIEESPGASGLAHFFEHLAFKGTHTIGTKDYTAEKENLAHLHALNSVIIKLKKENAPPAQIERLQKEFMERQQKETELVNQNEFVRIYQRNGGSDMNATTSNDFTSYFVSLPSNKLKLWSYTESERLKHPVLREFYKERAVVAEERRMRYDNSPDGKIYEAFMAASFDHSPYRINVIGFPEDIQNYTFEEAMEFRQKFYIPSRIVIAIAGNFDVEEAKKIITQNFEDIAPKEDTELKIEPENFTSPNFPRSKTIQAPDEPRFYLGFHRPAYPDPDDVVFDVIDQIMCEGRTSRLYSEIVQKKKLATTIGCFASLPASRLAGLFSIYAEPLKGHTNDEIKNEILSQIEDLKTRGVSEDELQKVRNRIKADLIWSLKSNMGLADSISFFEQLTGDWKYIYSVEEKMKAVTNDDIKKALVKYFVPQRQVYVQMIQKEPQ